MPAAPEDRRTAADAAPQPLGCRVLGAPGPAGVPPLLAVHGALTGARLTFASVARRWPADRCVVLLDRPGYDRTPGPWQPIGVQAARLVASAAEHGGGQPVDLLACSYGGLVALRAVEQAPRAWRSLVLVETPALDLCPADMVEPQRLLSLARRGHERAAQDLAGAFDEVFAQVDPGLTASLEPLLRAGGPGVARHREELALWTAMLDRQRLADAVSGHRPISVLAVSGTRSHPAHRILGACIAAALAGRHHVIEGAGHAVHLHPRFTSLLEAFLDEVQEAHGPGSPGP